MNAFERALYNECEAQAKELEEIARAANELPDDTMLKPRDISRILHSIAEIFRWQASRIQIIAASREFAEGLANGGKAK
ncbi:MAG TPA: hypothetical protein ENI81_04120 [Phycisphaerales bacterium]|nr:hypothetical protein [Phycisphaerales bacterium]